MHRSPSLASRFTSNFRSYRSEQPLDEDTMRQVAPSVFAQGKHESRSARYAYIPTIDVLRGLQQEGFEPFMVAQSRCKAEDKAAYTKHLVRLRHADGAKSRPETNEVILLNSHDGASAYQMLAGVFRFVCANGLVVGEASHDIRVPHKGEALGEVIDGAIRVLHGFEAIDAAKDGMKAITLVPEEEQAFATAALTLRFGERTEGQPPAPVTATQLNEARRMEDVGHSLWTTFQRVQENAVRGGQPGRSVQGRRMRTRAVESIDRGVALNRALWVLADEMRKLKT